MPKQNIGVLVFIPDEDYHITAGMWDVSKKWVLLDDYRVPDCRVTHWMKLPEIPNEFIEDRNKGYEIMKALGEILLANKKSD